MQMTISCSSFKSLTIDFTLTCKRIGSFVLHAAFAFLGISQRKKCKISTWFTGWQLCCVSIFLTACALRRCCQSPSRPASFPETAMWPSGPSGQPVPRNATTPTPPVGASAPEQGEWASSLWVEEQSVRSWRRVSRAALRQTRRPPAHCEHI